MDHSWGQLHFNHNHTDQLQIQSLLHSVYYNYIFNYTNYNYINKLSYTFNSQKFLKCVIIPAYQSGRNSFSAILNRHSTGADGAGQAK